LIRHLTGRGVDVYLAFCTLWLRLGSSTRWPTAAAHIDLLGSTQALRARYRLPLRLDHTNHCHKRYPEKVCEFAETSSMPTHCDPRTLIRGPLSGLVSLYQPLFKTETQCSGTYWHRLIKIEFSSFHCKGLILSSSNTTGCLSKYNFIIIPIPSTYSTLSGDINQEVQLKAEPNR
jgi:hypothetical protein